MMKSPSTPNRQFSAWHHPVPHGEILVGGALMLGSGAFLAGIPAWIVFVAVIGLALLSERVLSASMKV